MEIDVPNMLQQIQRDDAVGMVEGLETTTVIELPLRFTMQELIGIRAIAENESSKIIEMEVIVNVLEAANKTLMGELPEEE